jgi:hypothetical protein
MDHAMDVYDEACLQVTAAAERKHLIDKLLKEKRAALKAIKEGRKLRNGGSGGRPKKRAKAKSDALKHEIAKLERGFLIDENEPPAPPRPEQLTALASSHADDFAPPLITLASATNSNNATSFPPPPARMSEDARQAASISTAARSTTATRPTSNSSWREAVASSGRRMKR